MRTLRTEFIKGAVDLDGFPVTNMPEVAFVGRSNVGKSSLLNSIVNRKNIARTSSSPGKTREINFFNVEDKWIFADLPGFGYAKVSTKTRAIWKKLNFGYLEKRENLKFVCVLVDSRHDPQKIDMAIMEWLMNNKKKFIVILTKVDKIKPKQIEERVEQLEHLLSLTDSFMEVIPYSVVNGTGWKTLTAGLRKFLG